MQIKINPIYILKNKNKNKNKILNFFLNTNDTLRKQIMIRPKKNLGNGGMFPYGTNTKKYSIYIFIIFIPS